MGIGVHHQAQLLTAEDVSGKTWGHILWSPINVYQIYTKEMETNGFWEERNNLAGQWGIVSPRKVKTVSVFCNIEHPVGPPHTVQGSWSSTLSSLSGAVGSLQNLHSGIFAPILLWFRKVIMACYKALGFILTGWLGSRLGAEGKPPSPDQIGEEREVSNDVLLE